MKTKLYIYIGIILCTIWSCKQEKETSSLNNDFKRKTELTAKDILGNPDYLAISYGGYRKNSRDIQPTLDELKEDMKILSAMGVGILRTYNVQLAQASNILKAIDELKKEDANFEMYVMLGAWIDCKNAWTNQPVDHHIESELNEGEIQRAVELAKQYPDIVKVLAVGNEAMVKWAAAYYVQPNIILKWVNYLQDLKIKGALSEDLWITSSDNFSSWGGGETEYHVDDLNKLIKAVDYLSVHTYPMHDTHYNPIFWGVLKEEKQVPSVKRVKLAMNRAQSYAEAQYDSVVSYMKSIGVNKPVHIGETGWASVSNGHYGPKGSKATDEYKGGIYYNQMRKWTQEKGIACFYFEAFDEPWKDAHNQKGSENHFGLFTVDGKAKYVLWDLVDQGVFTGLSRNGNSIVKTYKGNKENLFIEVQLPPIKD